MTLKAIAAAVLMLKSEIHICHLRLGVVVRLNAGGEAKVPAESTKIRNF
jgi:hypothetical protein